MAKHYAIHICGGDYRPGRRDACPDPVHDWPLPAGYVDSFEVADARLRRRWQNVPCGQCGLYGWRPGRNRTYELGQDDAEIGAVVNHLDHLARSLTQPSTEENPSA